MPEFLAAVPLAAEAGGVAAEAAIPSSFIGLSDVVPAAEIGTVAASGAPDVALGLDVIAPATTAAPASASAGQAALTGAGLGGGLVTGGALDAATGAASAVPAFGVSLPSLGATTGTTSPTAPIDTGAAAPSAISPQMPTGSPTAGGASAAGQAPSSISIPTSTPTDLTSTTGAATGSTGGAPAGGTGSASGATTGLGGLASKAMGFLEKNPGIALGAGVMGLEALMGPSKPPGLKTLENRAGEAAGTAKTLSSYLFSGTLPAGAQQAIDNATHAAKAKIKSSLAQMGLAGSTMEAQQLQQVDMLAAAQAFTMADQLFAQGADYTKIADQLYTTILTAQQQQESDFTKSLSTFAGGLAGAKLAV